MVGVPALLDLTGQRRGRLIAIQQAGHQGRAKKVLWLCQCDCGNTKVVRSGDFISGNTMSCGCLRREQAKALCEANVTHGMTRRNGRSELYPIWNSMKGRCLNPNNTVYHLYGGRGIKVCEQWLGPDGFRNFLEDMGKRPPDPEGWVSKVPYYSVDRINPDGDYEPSNCRWATWSEQRRNHSTTYS